MLIRYSLVLPYEGHKGDSAFEKTWIFCQQGLTYIQISRVPYFSWSIEVIKYGDDEKVCIKNVSITWVEMILL